MIRNSIDVYKRQDEIREAGSVVLEGTDVKDAQGGAFQSDKNSSREYAVSLTLTDEGKTKFAEATEANVCLLYTSRCV